ncbi:MAG: acetolactate synthase small subunit, partial [Epulopiscium sp. Nele67-Bin004]
MKEMILSLQAKNNSSVISRVAGLFSRRGFSLSSIAGEGTHEPTLAKVIISVTEKEASLMQIRRQLEKLEDINEVEVLDNETDVVRELALIKVNVSAEFATAIKDLTQKYHFTILDVNSKEAIFELCNKKEVIDEFIEEVRPYGICESVRTGVIALSSV